jgi:hypothetical protein
VTRLSEGVRVEILLAKLAAFFALVFWGDVFLRVWVRGRKRDSLSGFRRERRIRLSFAVVLSPMFVP